jgi:hypothetical protein
MKTWRGTPNLFKIGKNYRELYVKTEVRFTVAGDIKSPKEHFCVTLHIDVLLTVTCTSTIHTERIVAFPLQQLRQCATLLRCTYISYFVSLVRPHRKKHLSAFPLAQWEIDGNLRQDLENKK